MSWQTIALADVPPSPWKNGGGVTRELVAWPSASDWLWRMSVAEVISDGPFSRFEGVQRWLAVLSGAGVRLDVGQPPNVCVHSLTPGGAPLRFDGGLPVFCTQLDGPTQDFNLMLRGAHASAHMLRLAGAFSCVAETIKTIAVYSISTGATVHLDEEIMTVPAHTLVWRTCPVGARLHVVAEHALWMEIAP